MHVTGAACSWSRVDSMSRTGRAAVSEKIPPSAHLQKLYAECATTLLRRRSVSPVRLNSALRGAKSSPPNALARHRVTRARRSTRRRDRGWWCGSLSPNYHHHRRPHGDGTPPTLGHQRRDANVSFAVYARGGDILRFVSPDLHHPISANPCCIPCPPPPFAPPRRRVRLSFSPCLEQSRS